MRSFAIILPAFWLAACGGSAHPAETPKPDDSAQAAAKDGDSKADASASAESNDGAPSKPSTNDSPSDASKADSNKPSEAPAKPARSAQDILTAPDVVFMLSFNDSDVKQTAESKCTASSANDQKKQSQCLSKARQALDVDGYRFREQDGKWWWLTLRTQGKVVHTLHKFEIEFGPEKDRSISIKPKGKDLGSTPERVPGPITIDVPNEYQIVLNDPKLGKLVYEAKIGIATEEKAK
jgi:hypothetical protein